MTTAVALLTVTEIAKIYGRKPGHIHVLAHRHGWRRIKHQGRVYYDLHAVDKTLGRNPG